ncbi:SRPBCC domain-containing protein [Gordonia sp. HY442]|uniref:SRPBCC domain-containing protein n=1 Tax=Gordonia zhenghanii TaxID=2911516 RepID=UPI001F16015C|nr:SRPBCC domain-containing protein [Gordonia zhenghanii]MCF8605969.1 SRPBCC domain-containing protein [Gordonia zhenghanii]
MEAPVQDTITVAGRVDAQLAAVWDAYVDPAARAVWSVPAGEALVYDKSDFREGGHDLYRCGPPDSLDFTVTAEYVRIVPEQLIVYVETVRTAGQPLATGAVVWKFEADDRGTVVTVTSQITSFVGQAMIDGNRSGHAKALEQLGGFLPTS